MRATLGYLLASFLVFWVSSCEKEDPEMDFKPLEEGVFQLVNEHRVSIGKNELIMDEFITGVCRDHSKNMAEGTVSFSHDGFNDRVDLIFAEIGGNSAGENIAMGFGSAEDAVEWWLNSPGHKANIEGDYTQTGVGVWQDNGGTNYFTQIFIKK